MLVNKESNVCSCIYCKEVKSSKGIFTHVDRTHLNVTKYSTGYNGKYDILSIRHRSKIEKYLANPSKCIGCNTELDYSKRHNKFCSTSCSATYNNARKDYSTFKPGPAAKVKELLNKQCKCCGNIFETYKKNKIFCTTKCSIYFKNAPLRAKRTEWQNYRADCQFRFNLKDYPAEFEFKLIEQYGWYQASNRGNNLTGISRDHMVSCKYGFENNIPFEHIRHPANCKLITHNENSSKNKKNSITYEELLERIKNWDIKYLHQVLRAKYCKQEA